jgi:two-component system response regulator (stage 0 sporulation protein F)
VSGRKRVAIVDDDRDMVGTLRDILELHGWETLTSYDGEEAVALSEQEDVDLFLMDVRMPRMSGVDAWHAIRSRQPKARSVLMTAYAPPEALALTPGEGVVRVLRKPVSIPELIAALEAARERVA